MTLKDAAKRYKELADELADAINNIADARDIAKFLAEQCRDNADPAYKLDEALSYLAPALAMTVSYARDYAIDAEKRGGNTDATEPED